MCNSSVLLIEIECKHCTTHFYICRACYSGQVYCSGKCRNEAYAEAHRKSQSNYRKSYKGRKKNRINAQNRRRIDKNKKNKKTVADESAFPPSFRVILYPILSNTMPRCSFCGAFGKVVDAFPPR